MGSIVRVSGLPVFLLVAVFLVACGGEDPFDALDTGAPLSGESSVEVQVPVLSAQAGKNMINFKCVTCHPNTRIKRARLSAPEWEIRILKCKDKPDGAKISPMDAKSLSSYLAEKYRD